MPHSLTSTDTAAEATLSVSFRSAMADICTPVSVVTTLEDGRPHGTTVSAFSSLSLAPPMILVALDSQSDLLSKLRRTKRLGLNVLGSGQTDLAARFATKGPDKFADVAWHSENEVPRLDGVSVWVSCLVCDVIEGGDHHVLFGRVLSTQTTGVSPMTYHARNFGTHF